MSPTDPSSDLDSRISAIVDRAVGRMRDELMHRVQETESRMRDITSRLGDEAPAVPTPEPAAVAAPELREELPSNLFDTIVAIDRGTSQQEILASLLEGAGGFAGRSALFLTHSEGAQGWGGYGFEEITGEMQEILLSYGEGPLAVLAEGRGCVALSADECAELCSQMGASPAVEGLLVPFVLRDRMAAALYVDRFEDDPPLGRQSLQLLSYVGAQAVEGLAMRERAETPTLHVATEATAPGVELWEGPTAAEPAPEVAPTPIEEVPVEEVAVEEAPVEVMEAEPVEAEPIEAEPEEAAEAAPADLTLEELPEEAPAAELVTQALPVMEPEVPIAEAETPIVVEQEPTAEELVEEPTPLLELPAEEEAVEPVEERAPWAETADDGLATVEVEPTPQPEEIIPAAGSPLGETGGETTEVRPPTDVAGPGWAFTANRAGAETGDEAQHEEARRLARLLVTEIKLYNEEQVEEGRRGNDIYARLKEDIDRSRQIFNERVDEDVRQETDYFHEEMVRILAGGNAEALGL